MPSSPASGTKQEKTMSSRLLTMKFMQRAAATAASKESPQPASSSQNNSNIPTPKRPRLSTGPPESPGATPSSDLEKISAALAAEEEKRREAVSRQAAEAGESEWVLDFGTGDATEQYAPPPLILADTSLDADDDDMVYGGRQSYGNFKRKKNAKAPAQTQTGETEGNEEEDEEEDDPDLDEVEAMIKKAKKKASKEKYKTQPVKLSKLTSISGGRQGTVGGNKSQKKRKHK